MFINITIKSKNRNSILKFLKFFKSFSKNKKLQLSRTFIFFQNKHYKKIFTILKSPHVNKTAQEQFEFIIFSQKIKIKTFQIIKTLIVLKKIQTTFFSEIQLNVKFVVNKTQKKKLLINKFNPDMGIFNAISKYNFKQIELYLLLFNYYGKYKFIEQFK